MLSADEAESNGNDGLEEIVVEKFFLILGDSVCTAHVHGGGDDEDRSSKISLSSSASASSS
jgi:hypothetical protein